MSGHEKMREILDKLAAYRAEYIDREIVRQRAVPGVDSLEIVEPEPRLVFEGRGGKYGTPTSVRLILPTVRVIRGA